MQATLEEKVRQGLIKKEADENYRLLTKPKYQAMLKESLKTMFGSMMGGLMGDDELKDEDLSADIMPEIEQTINEMLSDPKNIRKIAYEAAENTYTPRKELDAKLQKLCNLLDKDDFGKEAMQELKKANEVVYEVINSRDKVVSELTEVAKKDGMRKALTTKAEYEAIRRMFPTADEYITDSLNRLQLARKYLTDLQNAMMMDGETGQALGTIAGGIKQALEKTPFFGEEFQKEIILEKAKKIYCRAA